MTLLRDCCLDHTKSNGFCVVPLASFILTAHSCVIINFTKKCPIPRAGGARCCNSVRHLSVIKRLKASLEKPVVSTTVGYVVELRRNF